jgi:hypothetical protein
MKFDIKNYLCTKKKEVNAEKDFLENIISLNINEFFVNSKN